MHKLGVKRIGEHIVHKEKKTNTHLHAVEKKKFNANETRKKRGNTTHNL